MKMSPCVLCVVISCFFWFSSANAQTPISVKTNDNTTVTMFFPDPIVKIIAPAVNFKFEYDNETNIGLLQGRKGNPSNLTVISAKGHIYSFALTYAEEVDVFNFMLNSDQAVGQTHKVISPTSKQQGETSKTESTLELETDTTTAKTDTASEEAETPPTTSEYKDENSTDSLVSINDNQVGPSRTLKKKDSKDDLYEVDREEYYRIFCENNYLQKTIFKRSFRQKKGIVLKLNNILVDRNEIYFVLQIENNSNKEYKVNGLSFFKKLAVGQLQKIMKPLYTFNLQTIIDPESINEVVYVFKRFRISSRERVQVVLDELDANRIVVLPLDDKQVNIPAK